MEQNEHIDELIAKHLATETSVTEEEVLQNWMESSESNKLYYYEMKMVHEAGQKISIEDKINVNAAWNKFSKTLQEPQVETTILRKIVTSFYAKAAIFIGVLGLGYFFYAHLLKKEDQIVFSSSTTKRDNTLSDGTFVSLQPQSSISYSSSFNKSNREIQLSGEAYFHVQHNADLPFIISSGNVFIKDVGTAFTVKATPADSILTVNVTEGEVIFYSDVNAGISVLKDETGIYNLISKTFRKEETALGVNSSTIQTLSFENTRLSQVIDTINKVYNEHIQLSCEELESLELTAEFKERSASPIVETIAETFGLFITKDNGSLTLSSEDCKK